MTDWLNRPDGLTCYVAEQYSACIDYTLPGLNMAVDINIATTLCCISFPRFQPK